MREHVVAIQARQPEFRDPAGNEEHDRWTKNVMTRD
jgi:hypothetical protein